MKSLITVISLCLFMGSCYKETNKTSNWTEMVQRKYCPTYGNNPKFFGISFAVEGEVIKQGKIAEEKNNLCLEIQWVLCYYHEFQITNLFGDEERDIWILFINKDLSIEERQFLELRNWGYWEYYEYEDELEGSSILWSRHRPDMSLFN